MVLKSGIKRLSSLEKRYEVGTYIHFIRLVGRVARLLSIVAVYGWSRVFFRRVIFGLRGSLWRVFGSKTEEIFFKRSHLMF